MYIQQDCTLDVCINGWLLGMEGGLCILTEGPMLNLMRVYTQRPTMVPTLKPHAQHLATDKNTPREILRSKD